MRADVARNRYSGSRPVNHEIDIQELGSDRRGGHIAAPARHVAGRLGKVGVSDHAAIDPTAQVFLGPDKAQREGIAHRQVDHGIDAAVERVAAIRVPEGQLSRGVECLRIGGIRHQLDGAAHGAGSVERALRPAQHLDSIQIVEVGVDHDLAVLRGGRGAQRDIVQVKTHRRRIAAGGGHAAHFEFCLAGPAGSHGDARHRLHHRRQVGNAAVRKILPRQRGDADGRVLHGRFALLRGDHDLLQLIRLVGECAGRKSQRDDGYRYACQTLHGISLVIAMDAPYVDRMLHQHASRCSMLVKSASSGRIRLDLCPK